MLIQISELLNIDPLSWRILGFGSSIVAFTCFALSPSFYDLFGRWNLFKIAIYSVISLSVTTMMLFVKKCRRFRRSVLVKAHVDFLVLMLTSLCSIWQDRVNQKDNEEDGSRRRILNMCWFVAFGSMSLSLSSQLQLGFEVGISNFLFGSFLVLLMEMNPKWAPLAAISCYVITHFRFISDFLREMLGHVESSNDTVIEDVESDNHRIDLQFLDREMRGHVESSSDTALEDIESGVAEHLMHKNRLQEHAQDKHIPLPVYQAVNVGLEHAPQFRSAVSVDGKSYASEIVFPNRRSSEQNVAKLALQHITTEFKDEELSLILKSPASFKSMLHDYAKKMNLEISPYDTVPQEDPSGFKSNFIFDGNPYVGDLAKNKKEAEQSAACAAAIADLMLLSEIMKLSNLTFVLKASQHYAVSPVVKDSELLREQVNNSTREEERG